MSLTFGSTFWSLGAQADDVNGAAKAFAQAQEVMLAGDPARAADLYELADGLAPSAPALRNAARARIAADHQAMAATHAAELLRRYPSDKESRTIAEAILSKLGPQLTQVDVTCTERCTLIIDDKAISSKARESHSLFTHPGARTVVAVFDGARKRTMQVTAIPSKSLRIEMVAPPKSVEPALGATSHASSLSTSRSASSRRGISRLWVLGGTLVTLGVGTTAALSGMATLDTRDEIRKAVESGSQAQATGLYNEGRDQQIRTNLLIGATAVAGVSTIVLAVFTNWSGTESSTARDLAVVPSRDGVAVVYGSHF